MNINEYFSMLSVFVQSDKNLMQQIRTTKNEIFVQKCPFKNLYEDRQKRYSTVIRGLKFFICPDGKVSVKRQSQTFSYFDADGKYCIEDLNGDLLYACCDAGEHPLTALSPRFCCSPETASKTCFFSHQKMLKEDFYNQLLTDCTLNQQMIPKPDGKGGVSFYLLENGFCKEKRFNISDISSMRFSPQVIESAVSASEMQRIKEALMYFLSFESIFLQMQKIEELDNFVVTHWNDLMTLVKNDIPDLSAKIDAFSSDRTYKLHRFYLAESLQLENPDYVQHDGWMAELAEMKAENDCITWSADAADRAKTVAKKAAERFHNDGAFCLYFPKELESWDEEERDKFCESFKHHLRTMSFFATVYSTIIY